MITHRGRIAKALLASTFLIHLFGSPAFAGLAGSQEFGEVRPDKALVYFIRTPRFNGGARTQYLYADDTFLGVMRSGSYGFAYVAPGKHLLWTNWTHVTREIEMVAGETYYLDVWQTIAEVGIKRGRELIEAVGDFATPTESELATARTQIAHRYERAKRKESEKDKIEVEGPALAVEPPADLTGLIKVPANLPIEIELVENVCSGLSVTGGTVWFQVAGDVEIDEHVIVRKGSHVQGTIRESEPGAGGGKEGVLEIVVPALTTEGGSLLPTVGQIVSSGEERGDKASGVGYFVGVFGALAVKGREAYHLAGEQFVVHTRQETWVRARDQAALADVAPESDAGPPAADVLVLHAQSPAPIKFRPKKGKVSGSVDIDLDANEEPREVMVYQFGAWVVPDPVKSIGIARHGKVWRCTFDGWDLARHLHEGRGDTAIPITLRGALRDGTTFVAEANVALSLELE